ncbi:MAG: carboxypeptidase-like regulatory domain-containing protein [Sphingobacteriales bacterium]|nr:MAG: carboxypeptidase-like regulatory domain-containing protein [Sphingobacteriales bacterium]
MVKRYDSLTIALSKTTFTQIKQILKYFLIILLCFLVGQTGAQSISGKVVDAKTGEALFPVTVVNMLTQQAVYTSESGTFTVPAKVGDELAFTYIGYKSVQKLVTTGATSIRVEMSGLSFRLNEMVIRPHQYSPYQIDSIERRATYKRSLARQKSSVFSPVSFIAERFSKSSKAIFNFQRSYNYWEDQRYIDSKYTPELVSELTGLTADSLAYFMNAYPMDTEYARAASDLELKMWVRTNYKQWRKNPIIPNIKADSALMQKK